MIAFEDKIATEMKDALRAKDQVKLDCLRAMKSALKYKFVEKSQADVTEDEAIAIFQSLIKQRKDAVDQYTKFNRPEQAAKEQREIDVISGFLPQQLSDDEIKTLIADAIKTSAAASQKDLGKVMKELKPKIVGRADAKKVTDLIRAQLPAA